ncbi:hypothetical protein RJD39_16110 [Vibrio scophthalmi]|uniref:hypothetical protein n=1 Tax=Vibrio scophthalmi TaxID=45658 RepID=UPI0038732CED
MEAELLEIKHFLAQHPPFDELEDDVLSYICRHVEIAYYREDTPIIHFGDHIHDLYPFNLKMQVSKSENYP